MVKYEKSINSQDVVFIFLDRIDTCQTNWTAELVKNLSDYVITVILSKGFNILQGVNEDQLLREAAKQYKHAVVLSTGTEFINGAKFFDELRKFVYEQEYFLMGHIPDRDDGYYELHEQCYMINLDTYTELGSPTVGKFAYYSAHTQIEPKRSDENIHDDYTPIWVSAGDTERKYKHKWHGWNILSVAFANKKLVLPFPERFRNNKKYYYPNYEPAFIKSCAYLYGKNEVAAQTLFYPYNTELFNQVEFSGPIRQLVIQSSGLQFIEYLIQYGYDSNTVVRFVDYNLFALECMKEIVENWDGVNYLDFVKAYAGKRAAFLGKDGTDWLTFTGSEQPVDTETWRNIMSVVNFEFSHQDLVLNTGLPAGAWLDCVPNTIVHISHIFNYDPVSTFLPLRHRIHNERLLQQKIKQHNPDAVVITVDETIGDIFTNNLPTWHQNGEWNV